MKPASSTLCESLAATLTPGEAAATPWQVVIIGAGPAGSASAIRLASRGLRVLLVDRDTMPRWKVCGSCLSVAALGELRMLGFDDVTQQPLHASTLHAVRVVAATRSTRIPLPGGAAVSRERLDHALVRRAIEAGCHWLPHLNVAALDDRSAPAHVLITTGSSGQTAATATMLEAEYCILATGLADHVRIQPMLPGGVGQPAAAPMDRSVARNSRIGLGTTLAASAVDLPSGELIMAVGRRGYCGLVRLEDGRIDLAAAIDREALAGPVGPARAVWATLNEAAGADYALGIDRHSLGSAVFRATPALTHVSALVAGSSGRILRAGDAAGYVEPFTGEGIGWALANGRIVADALLARSSEQATELWNPIAAVARYRDAHRHHFRPLHDRCRSVSFALRRPAVVSAAMHAARLAPWAARRLVPALIGSHVTEAACS